MGYLGPGYDNPFLESLGSGHLETELIKESKRHPNRTVIADHVIKNLKQWKVYHFHDTSDTSKMKQPCPIDDNKYFKEDASNLAAFLYKMKQNHPQNYKSVLQTVQLVAPFIKDFNLSPIRCDNYYNYWLFLYHFFSKDLNTEKIYDILMESYSNEVGGFTSKLNEDIYELRATAFGGICSFLIKDNAVGKKTAEFFMKLYDDNKQENNFYLIRNKNNQLVTNFPKEQERFYNYYVEVGKPLYYSVSLAIVNLCLAYMVNKEKNILITLKNTTMF